MRVDSQSEFHAKIPESSLQPEFVEELLNLGRPRPLPIAIEAASISFRKFFIVVDGNA
jgi:hypothetical protein